MKREREREKEKAREREKARETERESLGDWQLGGDGGIYNDTKSIYNRSAISSVVLVVCVCVCVCVCVYW